MTASTLTTIRDDKGHVVKLLFGKPVKISHCQRAAAVESLNESFDRDARLQEAIRERYPHRD